MNKSKFNRLLRELTPEIWKYLFPGMPEPEVEPGIIGRVIEGISGGYMDDAFDDDIVGRYAPGDEAYYEAEPKSAEPRESVFRWRRLKKAIYADIAEPDEETASPNLPEPDAEALDPRTEQILAEIRRLQEKYGVSIDELEVMLGYTVRLSPVRITRGGKIFLPDYDYREVKMPNVAKALYFLYLRHPEGLRYKEIADHKEELLHIYEGISGRDNPEEMEKSIDILVNPLGNGLNVNASRVKTAFRNVVSDRIARFYYISGAAGDVKKVPLDRDLVLWDH